MFSPWPSGNWVDVDWIFVPVSREADEVDLNLPELPPEARQSFVDLVAEESDNTNTESIVTMNISDALQPMVQAGFPQPLLEQLQSLLDADRTKRINPAVLAVQLAKPDWVKKAVQIESTNRPAMLGFINLLTRVGLVNTVPATRIAAQSFPALNEQVQELLDQCL